jgi:hypothetical protein
MVRYDRALSSHISDKEVSPFLQIWCLLTSPSKNIQQYSTSIIKTDPRLTITNHQTIYLTSFANMRYSTIFLTGMATYAYAQDPNLASLSSELASLTGLGPSIASAVTDNLADLTSLSNLGPSIQSVASAAIASATADGNLDDLQSAASRAESSLREVWSTLDPDARSSVSSALSALGLDYASITSAAGITEASATSSSDSDDAEETTGSQTRGAQNTGSSVSAASTTDSEGMAEATAFPMVAIGAGIVMIALL